MLYKTTHSRTFREKPSNITCDFGTHARFSFNDAVFGKADTSHRRLALVAVRLSDVMAASAASLVDKFCAYVLLQRTTAKQHDSVSKSAPKTLEMLALASLHAKDAGEATIETFGRGISHEEWCQVMPSRVT